MAERPLSDILEDAFIRCRDLQAPLAARLQAFADELRRLGPHFAEAEDVTERLDVVPAHLRVLVVRWPKYACRQCEDGIVQAPAPVGWSRAACRPRRWSARW